MRARLHAAWPALAEVFGLYPDDVGRFAPAEWNRYLDRLDQIDKNARKGQQRPRRRGR